MSYSEKFVDKLANLADPENQEGRAKLAALRRGTSGEERDLARVYPIVLPLAPQHFERQQAYIDLACLFGLHPTDPKTLPRSVTLAEALRALSGKSGSIEARFQALLQSHRDELLGHLRNCVGLARSNDIPLRWVDVLDALLWWDNKEAAADTKRKSQQRRWAQEFWGPETPEDRAGVE